MGHQLTHEAFVILEGDDALVLVPRNGLLELNSLLDESLDPETNRAGKNRERCDGDLAAALSSPSRIRPGEKSENAARSSSYVAEVEVIGGRIVEVYRALDQPEAEGAGVEIQISLGVARNAGDVMNTGGPETHRPDSCLASLRRLAIALLLRGASTLFLFSGRCHVISNLYPSLEATDMPFAEALM